MSKKLLLLTLLAMVFMAGPAVAAVEPVTSVVITQVDNPEAPNFWLESITVGSYTVAVDELVTGTSTGVATAQPTPYDDITAADDFDLNLFAGRASEDPPTHQIRELAGQSTWTDTNGDNPDFFVFETGGNQDINIEAILFDGTIGQTVAVPQANWGNTGLSITTSGPHNGQSISGIAFAITDLLDADGNNLTNSSMIQGIQISSAGYDPSCVCAISPPAPEVVNLVLNPSFEDPVLAEDGYTWGDVPGWTLVGGEATDIEGSGVWNVTLADFDPVLAPEGENVLYTEYLPEGIAKGVAQVLTETFAADTDYTLTAEVGNSNYYYNGGYSVQLLAGGTVIAEDNDTLWPEYKTWATSTVAYTYDSADSALVGQPLEIRLLNLELDKDSPPAGEVVGVEFDNVTLSYAASAEPGVTIPVDPNSDIAAANELAQAGDTIEFAEGTYYITSQIEVKDGVTYQGAGVGLTIIDGNDLTRAFVAWGDRGATNGQVDANGAGVPNTTGPKGWLLEGMTIQNCVADTVDRYDILSSARDLLDNYPGAPYTLATAQEENGGITNNPEWFDILSGSADDNLTDAELQAYLDANPVGSAGHLVVNDDQSGDGGAITIHDGAIGTIQSCDFLNNHTPAEGDGDDGGAVNITGLSVVTIDDCWFDGNYACSPTSVSVDGADGDGGHIKVQGSSASANTPGTTLIATRSVFLNGNAEDDSGAVQSAGVGSIVRLDACRFEGNTSWDNGNVLLIGNEESGELTVTNCIFANNITSANNSPDRMCQVRRNSKFINCTFVDNNQEDQDMIYNNANATDTDGDGIDDETADATQVINCIFVNNVVGNGDDVLGSRNADFTIAATNCLFFGNTLQNGDAADNTQRPDEETGSILADPLLDADHAPGAGSPAIDAGVDPATVGATLTTDFNGDPRPQGAGYDIGAFETPAN